MLKTQKNASLLLAVLFTVTALFAIIPAMTTLTATASQGTQLGITGTGTKFPADSQGQNNWYVLWGTTIANLSESNCTASTDEGTNPQQWKGPLTYATISETFIMPDSGVAALKYKVVETGTYDINFTYTFTGGAGGNGVEMGVKINETSSHSKTINNVSAAPFVNNGSYTNSQSFSVGDEILFYCDSISQNGGWDNVTYSIDLIKEEPVTTSVDSIAISGVPSKNSKVGDTGTLVAAVLPQNATNSAVVWTSNDSNVVEINSTTGVWNAKTAGTATITATAGGKSSTVTLTVEQKAITILKTWNFNIDFPAQSQGQNGFHILWGTSLDNISESDCTPSIDESSGSPQQWKGKTQYATIAQTFMMPGEGVIGTKWVAPVTGDFQIILKWKLSPSVKSQINLQNTSFDGFQMGILDKNGVKLYSKNSTYNDDADQKIITVSLNKGENITVYMDKLGVQDFDMADVELVINQISGDTATIPKTGDRGIFIYLIIVMASFAMLTIMNRKRITN